MVVTVKPHRFMNTSLSLEMEMKNWWSKILLLLFSFLNWIEKGGGQNGQCEKGVMLFGLKVAATSVGKFHRPNRPLYACEHDDSVGFSPDIDVCYFPFGYLLTFHIPTPLLSSYSISSPNLYPIFELF